MATPAIGRQQSVLLTSVKPGDPFTFSGQEQSPEHPFVFIAPPPPPGALGRGQRGFRLTKRSQAGGRNREKEARKTKVSEREQQDQSQGDVRRQAEIKEKRRRSKQRSQAAPRLGLGRGLSANLTRFLPARRSGHLSQTRSTQAHVLQRVGPHGQLPLAGQEGWEGYVHACACVCEAIRVCVYKTDTGLHLRSSRRGSASPSRPLVAVFELITGDREI